LSPRSAYSPCRITSRRPCRYLYGSPPVASASRRRARQRRQARRLLFPPAWGCVPLDAVVTPRNGLCTFSTARFTSFARMRTISFGRFPGLTLNPLGNTPPRSTVDSPLRIAYLVDGPIHFFGKNAHDLVRPFPPPGRIDQLQIRQILSVLQCSRVGDPGLSSLEQKQHKESDAWMTPHTQILSTDIYVYSFILLQRSGVGDPRLSSLEKGQQKASDARMTSQTVYNTKGLRTHTHRELIQKWLWEPKGSSLEYI